MVTTYVVESSVLHSRWSLRKDPGIFGGEGVRSEIDD